MSVFNWSDWVIDRNTEIPSNVKYPSRFIQGEATAITQLEAYLPVGNITGKNFHVAIDLDPYDRFATIALGYQRPSHWSREFTAVAERVRLLPVVDANGSYYLEDTHIRYLLGPIFGNDNPKWRIIGWRVDKIKDESDMKIVSRDTITWEKIVNDVPVIAKSIYVWDDYPKDQVLVSSKKPTKKKVSTKKKVQPKKKAPSRKKK